MLIVDLLLPLLLGLLVGLVLGRGPRPLLRLRLDAVWLLWAAAGLQTAEYGVPVLHRWALHGARPWFTAAIFGLVALCLWSNARTARGPRRTAWAAIGLGAVLNAVPLVLNGTMPFNRRAALFAGMPANKLDEVLVKNGVANTGTRIAWLGDVIPVRVLHVVISLGDCAIVAGVVLLVVASMSPRPRAAARPVDSTFPTVPV